MRKETAGEAEMDMSSDGLDSAILVHRHADPITTPQPTESIIPK
jgi:hypothetical protein